MTPRKFASDMNVLYGLSMSGAHNFEFVTVTHELASASTISMTPEISAAGDPCLAVAMKQEEREKTLLGRAPMRDVAVALDGFLAAGRVPRLTSAPVFLVDGNQHWVLRFYVDTTERDGIWLATAGERHLVTVDSHNLAELDGLLAGVKRT